MNFINDLDWGKEAGESKNVSAFMQIHPDNFETGRAIWLQMTQEEKVAYCNLLDDSTDNRGLNGLVELAMDGGEPYEVWDAFMRAMDRLGEDVGQDVREAYWRRSALIERIPYDQYRKRLLAESGFQLKKEEEGKKEVVYKEDYDHLPPEERPDYCEEDLELEVDPRNVEAIDEMEDLVMYLENGYRNEVEGYEDDENDDEYLDEFQVPGDENLNDDESHTEEENGNPMSAEVLKNVDGVSNFNIDLFRSSLPNYESAKTIWDQMATMEKVTYLNEFEEKSDKERINGLELLGYISIDEPDEVWNAYIEAMERNGNVIEAQTARSSRWTHAAATQEISYSEYVEGLIKEEAEKSGIPVENVLAFRRESYKLPTKDLWKKHMTTEEKVLLLDWLDNHAECYIPETLLDLALDDEEPFPVWDACIKAMDKIGFGGAIEIDVRNAYWERAAENEGITLEEYRQQMFERM